MHAHRRRLVLPKNERRGGALVGVLAATPALALLGAALLQASGIEGDRTLAQSDDVQALLWAEAGLGRSAWALACGSGLESAGNLLPPAVALVVATQAGRTSGLVTWNGDPVVLTAVGAVRGARRTLRQTFDTADLSMLYKNVLVSPGVIQVASPNPPTVVSTVEGPVLTGSAATNLSAVLGTHPVTVSSVPQLDVAGFIQRMRAQNAWTSVSGAQVSASSAASPLLLDAVASTRVYYSNDPGLAVSTNGDPARVVVRGTVFWLIENGARFGKEIQVSAYDADSRLVIVATQDPGNGKGWDLDKLGVIDVPTVLVSDGKLFFNKESVLDNISMYGSQIDAAKGQDFGYDPAVMDPFIDALQANGDLPLPQGSGLQLVRRAGTWEEVVPTL